MTAWQVAGRSSPSRSRGEGADGCARRLGDARDGARPPRSRRSRGCPGVPRAGGHHRTIRCSSATWRRPSSDCAQAVERNERICVHGDYDVDGICSTALAVLTLRELGADVGWHLPSRFEEGYGVSATTIARLAEEGVELDPHGRLRHHRRRRGGRGAAARRRHDRHRPSPARRRRCRTARSSPRGPPTTRFPISAAPASSSSSRRRCSEPTILRSRGTRISSRSRRSPTSCRSSTRTARSRAPACARSRARRSPGCGR